MRAILRRSFHTTLALAVLIAPVAYSQTVVVFDPFEGTGRFEDLISRGFFVTGYGATNLATVTLGYTGGVAGIFTTMLTARLNRYDGPVIGSKTITTSLPGLGEALVVYDFGGAPIPLGSLITFTQTLVSGPDIGGFQPGVFFDLGSEINTQIFETEGTFPPLDVNRRQQVGLIITAIAPEPATLTLMATGLIGLAGFVRRRRRTA